MTLKVSEQLGAGSLDRVAVAEQDSADLHDRLAVGTFCRVADPGEVRLGDVVLIPEVHESTREPFAVEMGKLGERAPVTKVAV